MLTTTANTETANTDFDGFKRKSVNDHKPTFFDTSLNQMEVEGVKTLSVQGTPLEMNYDARKDLHDILNVPTSFATHVEQVLGQSARLSIVDSLRDAMSQRDNLNFKLSLDPNRNQIVGISRDSRTVEMEGFFELFEMFMNRYDLDVVGHSSRFGLAEISTKSPRQVSIGGKTLKDEVFNTGVTFRYKNGLVSAHPYTYRLVCTNGMIGSFNEDYQLSSSQKNVVASFFGRMDRLSEQSFIPDVLRDHVMRAITTRASVDEVFKMREKIDDYSVTEFTNPLVESFIPAEEIKDAYANAGYDVNEMSITQRQSCMTNLSYWDVINGMTRFASHDYTSDGFQISENEKMQLQRHAGYRLQRKTIDCENTIPTPPEFSSAMLN